VSPEPLRAPSPRPRTHRARLRVEEQGDKAPEHRRSAARPGKNVEQRKSRGEEGKRASWLHPVRCGPKRRREGGGPGPRRPKPADHRPRGAPVHPCTARPPPGRWAEPSTRPRPSSASQPQEGRRRPATSPPLATAWAGLSPSRRVNFLIFFFFFSKPITCLNNLNPQMNSEKYKTSI
jgi:hypothetical protein